VFGILAFGLTACASTGGVPRPFPGAALPPGASEPVATAAPEATPPQPLPEPAPAAEAPPLDSLVETALGFRGTPYRNGGSDPSGFDCSGFVQWVFSRHGLVLPRQVEAQFTSGREIDRDEVQPGDLVFFETVTPGASHVGIALGGGEFVHAPSSRGVVRVERYTGSYWKARWVGARRITAIDN
jgi:cell wall-associated NlpC family hydrolase